MRRSAVLVALAITSALAGAQVVMRPLPSRREIADSAVAPVAKSRLVSRVASSQLLSATVSLQPRDLSGLQAFADAVSDPKSPQYGHFITPQEVGDRFGASATDRQAVVDFLASKGLVVTLVAPNGLAVIAQGTAEQFQNAFSTTLANYSGLDADGRTITFRANAAALTVPATVASVVTNVSGLENYTRPQPRSTLTPIQTNVAYGIQTSFASGYSGAGRHVAISNFDGYRISDAVNFANTYGIQKPAGGYGSNITKVIVAADGETQIAEGEGDLDIQMVLGQAPLSDIRIYDGATNANTNSATADLIGTLTRESSDNWADVITESYGFNLGTSTATSAHNIHLAMTAQGITYMAASGDSGTSIGVYAYPDYEPEVLQVGGTAVTVTSAGQRTAEVGWNNSGGGWRNNSLAFNALPSWQKGFGVPTNVNRRLVPDIAFHASGTQTSTAAAYYYSNGGTIHADSIGTSFACPVFAGSLATLESRLFGNASNASSGRLRLGRLQNFIYGQNANAVLSSVYNDITSGTNGNLPGTSTGTSNTLNGPVSNATTGWDYVTGWGSINLDAFYQSLLGVVPARMTVTPTFGNYVGDVTVVPVAVEFRTPGTTTVVGSQTVYPAANGTLTLSAPSAGTYDVAIKASHWLRKTMASVVFTTGTTTTASVTLINGDVDGDNFVTAGDRSLVTAAIGTQVGDPGYNPAADLNGDGFVTAADRSIVTTSIGLQGDN